MVEDSGQADIERLDLTNLALFVGNRLSDLTLERLAAAGFDGLRQSHGFLIQHLVGAQPTVGEIAKAQGVSAQAISKSADDLARLGYVERLVDPADGRLIRLALTERGKQMLQAARQARAAAESRMARVVGDDALAQTRATLKKLLRELGGSEAVRTRSVRPPR